MARAVLFDLFGTVVHFCSDVPPVETSQQRWQKAMPWLEVAVRECLPDVPFEAFLSALAAVTQEIVASRPPDYREVLSVERFGRTLRRLGIDGTRQSRAARVLATVHMTNLLDRTQRDASALSVLRELRNSGYKLGLVSNFDDGPTARSVLQRHDLHTVFDAILISAEFGRRKPHPAIFRAALDELGVEPRASWFVGDNYEEDVLGAQSVGMRAIWIHAANARNPANPVPSRSAPLCVGALAEVLACIGTGDELATHSDLRRGG